MCNCNGKLKDPRYEQFEHMLKKYRGNSAKLIPVMQETQAQFGYVPVEAIKRISQELRLPASEIYGVATFYGQFHLKPRGKNIIKVCTGTACHVRGGGKVLEAIKKNLGLEDGEFTTKDMLFTLEPVACLGACGMAPVIMINDDAYGRLTPEDIPAIIAQYEEKEGDQGCVA